MLEHKLGVSATKMFLECGEGALVSNPLYRCFQLIQVIECIIAIVSLPLVYCRYIQSAAFHINLKILLCLYYQIAGVYVLVVLICTIFQAVLWLTSRNPCDVYPSRFAHEFFNLSELYCLLYLLASQPLVSLERTIATLRVDTYEKCSKKSAAVLYVIASLAIPGGLLYYVYHDVRFTEPHLSCFSDQSKATDRITIVSALAIFLSLSSVIVQKILTFINSKRKTRATDTRLSTQYQLSENIAATSFVSWILFLQMLASVGYSAASLICGFFIEGLFNNDRNKKLIAKEGYYIIPLAMVLLPWLSVYLLKERNKTRSSTIESSIHQSKGDNAMVLYSSMLKEQWSK
ncbi:hypothetical protein RB195_000057 [Necator americanus]|uniref:G-protein coupled receptors family 1 profile domain-containing protein n=1 Tax=Necator americanus TaxID=51031 RepID=A0ABR1D7S5_NECAM